MKLIRIRNHKKTHLLVKTALGVLFLGEIFGIQSVEAASVDVDSLRDQIESQRSGFPDDMEERPLEAESIRANTITVYTDSDMIEACDVVDGASLEMSITDATPDAVFGEYDSATSTGMGWIPIENFIEDPTYEKDYATARDPMTIYENRDYTGKTYQIEKYSGLIRVSHPGKKNQVIYETEDGYGIGWVKSKEYANKLEYDGRPKQLIVDGTYVLHNLSKIDRNRTYAEDSYAQTATFVYWKDDMYYLIDEKGRWLKCEENGDAIKTSWSKSGHPEMEGLFLIERANDGYVIQNTSTGGYLGMTKKGKLYSYEGEKELQTTWRISANKKMLSLTEPMVITQYDPKWCGLPYGTDDITGCIGAAGCGVLAPVNAVYSLTGQYMDVLELIDYAVEKNYRVIGSGTEDGIFKAIADKNGEKYGFAWDGSSDKIDVLVQKLQQGEVAVSHVDGHFLSVVSCSADGKKFLLLDSNRLPKRKTSAFGDWVSVERLQEGTLASKAYYFYKQFDGKSKQQNR